MDNLMRQSRAFFRRMDIVLLLTALACSCYGLLLVLAATASSSAVLSRSFFVQAIALMLGFGCMFVVALFDLDLLTDLWPILYALAAGAIVITILFGKGPTGDSNRNWIYLGPVSVQPTEFVKLAYILVFAKALDKVKDSINRLSSLLYLAAVAGGLLILMVLQGDMGTTLVFFFITALMLFCAGLDWKFFAGGLVAVVLAAPFAWDHLLSGYMRDRILYGFRPELDPTNYGFQALQSKIAIGRRPVLRQGLSQRHPNLPDSRARDRLSVCHGGRGVWLCGQHAGFAAAALFAAAHPAHCRFVKQRHQLSGLHGRFCHVLCPDF